MRRSEGVRNERVLSHQGFCQPESAANSPLKAAALADKPWINPFTRPGKKSLLDVILIECNTEINLSIVISPLLSHDRMNESYEIYLLNTSFNILVIRSEFTRTNLFSR